LIDGRMTLKAWTGLAVEAGLDGVDLSVLFVRNRTPRLLTQLRRELESGGLPVVMITTYPDFSHPDPIQLAREMEYFRSDIALASELGAAYLRITAGQAHPSVSADDGVPQVVEQFKRAAESAERFDVGLLFENHSKPGAWDLPDFACPTEIFLRIAEAIEDTGIGINFDTANPLAFGDDPLPVLEAVIDRVVTVHASDTSVRGRLEPVLLGQGLVPFDLVFERLKRQGFDGWICIEEASGRGAEGVGLAAGFVRDAWTGSLHATPNGRRT
jgi:sugar phosphate isomerase/epimerase